MDTVATGHTDVVDLKFTELEKKSWVNLYDVTSTCLVLVQKTAKTTF